MAKTLSQLREGARQRSDMEYDSGAVSDLEVNQYINEAYHDLYDLITAADEARLFTKNATQPPKVGDYAFQLPSDFYRLVSLHVYQDGRYTPSVPADPSEYPELAAASDYSATKFQHRYFVRWDINTGERLVFVFPAPSSETLAITYWPQPKELSVDTESLDNPASWLEYVMVGAAIRMLNKVERDATALLLLHRGLGKRIQKAVYATDYNYPSVVRDLSYRDGYGNFRSW